MVSVNLKSLMNKLNTACRNSLEAAVGLTLSLTHYNTEIEHWLLKILETPNSDLEKIFHHYRIESARVQRDLTKTLDSLKRGNARSPVLAQSLVTLARDAWLLASVEFGAPHVRSGHLLCALLDDESIAGQLSETSKEFAKLSPEVLRKEFFAITQHSAEEESSMLAAGQGASESGKPAGSSPMPALNQYTIDLTARALAGEIDPVLGRDAEIRQMVDILMRRRQNNPILTGEAGVGKTALAEGLALRIAAGDVPPALQKVAVRTLDLALLQAGAGIRGEFENRLKSVISEIKASPQPIILFIDEAHTLVGAGGASGQSDAANILKPALARGELRTIAATTWAEYKKYFEGDAALARRFQVIKVEEPSEPVAVTMLQGSLQVLETHHGVRILDEAINEAVRLSHRYISGRQLPDKAVSLLDTACARVGLSNSATPGVIENCRRQIEQLSTSIRILQREMAAGSDHGERLAGLMQDKERWETRQAELEQRWQQEAELVTAIRSVRSRLETMAAAVNSQTLDESELQSLRNDLRNRAVELKKLQGETPLMQVCVDGQAVAEVVSEWTGIPVGRMVKDEIQAILNLKQRLEERIIGQSHALEAITQQISTARANLADPRRPIGVFLLVGSSGVGKTETALALTDLLYGSEQNITVINMSEFKEEHKVSLLMGSPPGYVGYREGGVLTEAVRRRPYSIVLLDEMEKAHPGVQDIFYQVFDKGMLRDGEGRDIDFKNNIIIMTSNAGTDTIMKYYADPETMPDAAGLAEALRPELLKTFKPAFLGRVTLVPYFPLNDDILQTIVRLQLDRIGQRVQDHYRAQFGYSPDLIAGIAGRCKEVDTGARNIDHILNRTLLPELAAQLLSHMSEGEKVGSVKVGLNDNGCFQYEIA